MSEGHRAALRREGVSHQPLVGVFGALHDADLPVALEHGVGDVVEARNAGQAQNLAQLVVAEPRPAQVLELDPAVDHEQDGNSAENPSHRSAPVGDADQPLHPEQRDQGE